MPESGSGRSGDVLIHNAGVLPDERIETEDGLELSFATHVVGPFLLTGLLRPALEKSSDARVIWVSSGGMYTRRLNVRDPNWKKREYDGVLAYADTKRAQVVLADLWARGAPRDLGRGELDAPGLGGHALGEDVASHLLPPHARDAAQPGRGSRQRGVARLLPKGEPVDQVLLLRSRDSPDPSPALHEGVR